MGRVCGLRRKVGEESQLSKRAPASLIRRLLEKNTCQERGARAQQPFDPPNLDGLPVQRGPNRENHADCNRKNQTSQSYRECNQGESGNTEPLPRAHDPALDVVELEMPNPGESLLQPVLHNVRRDEVRRPLFGTRRPTYMTKARQVGARTPAPRFERLPPWS